ncbi:MAG TPA: hypothetical protein PKO06_22315, partial [Candidatus Ozemobacteraceae bacterium]|nr:hypothetical protein [Candidatus Ozemobacteraceae bacterium]
MKRFVLVALLALLPVCTFAADTPVKAVMINGLRYEASLASQAVAPKTLLEIALGTGKENVGSDEQDAEHRTEGAPYAFCALKDGSVWVLDTINQKLKHFSAEGKCLTEVAFPEHPEKFARIRDFAIGPKESFYFLCSTDGKVERVDGQGKLITEIEGLSDVWEIGADPKGNVLVKNPAMNALMRFNPEGELIESYDGQADYSVYTDADGHPYGVRSDDKNAVLFKLTAASPTASIDLAKFPLELAAGNKAHYYSARVCGVDQTGTIYLELIAGDDDGVIHQNRLLKVSPDGKTLGKLEMLNTPFMAPDLPRHRVVMPDGRHE